MKTGLKTNIVMLNSSSIMRCHPIKINFILILIISLTISGCCIIGPYYGRKLRQKISDDAFLLDFYIKSEFVFDNQFDNENFENYTSSYQKIIRLKGNYELIRSVLNDFVSAKLVNEIKFKESGMLYDTYDNLYDSRDNVQDFTKDDPWGHPYHYAIFNQNEFIMGTSGPNGKWDVKLDDQLNEKLFYGNFNCFKDDLFMKIKFAKGQDTLGGQDSK